MNKRNTEGFVLAYVMIVIAVVSAITMALTTSTLNVLKAQEQSVERMQTKYQVMGEIEKVAAALESLDSTSFSSIPPTRNDTSRKSANDDAGILFANYLKNKTLFPYPVTQAIYDNDSDSEKYGTIELIVQVKDTDSAISIDSTIILNPNIKITDKDPPSYSEDRNNDGIPEEYDPDPYWIYQLLGINSLYFESYTISTPEPEGGAA